MDKETLSNYGWIVICILVLSVMIALATPFGNYVANAVKSTTQGLFDVSQKAGTIAGLDLPDQSFYDAGGGNSGTPTKDPALNLTGVSITSNSYEYGDYRYTRVILSGNEYGASTLEEAKEIAKQQLVDESGITWDEILAILAEEGVTEDWLWAEMNLTVDTFESAVLGEWMITVTDKNKKTYGPILESINGMSVTAIGDDAFYNCTALTSITIPDSITTIGEHAFKNCDSLSSITIPDSVTTIGIGAFSGCDSLSSITLPDSITTISESIFFDCDSLSSITIPDSVTIIGIGAFNNCDSLSSITIPDSVTFIGSSAFNNCDSLSSITIPDSVTTIDYCTFYSCTSLTSITFEGTIAQWNAITFGSYWNKKVPATKVICSDGDVTL